MAISPAGLVQQHGELLRQNTLFAGLDGVTLAKLAARLEVMRLEDGDDVVRLGEVGDAMYVISRGQFGVFGPGFGGAAEERLRTRGEGDVIGEMALLTDHPRSAPVRELRRVRHRQGGRVGPPGGARVLEQGIARVRHRRRGIARRLPGACTVR